MSNKPSTTESAPNTVVHEEGKDQNLRYNLSKFDYDLYKEEDDTAEKVIRVKRVNTSNKIERWKIFEDNKIIWVVEGSKLTNKEKDFLRSVEGVNFLIRKAKVGIKSFSALKTEINKELKKKDA